MVHIRQSSLVRRGWIGVAGGVLGVVVVLGAAVWACTVVPNTATVVSPNSTTNSGSTGVTVSSSTTHSSGNGLPTVQGAGYFFHHRPFGVGTVCEHTSQIGTAVSPVSGNIPSTSRSFTWNTAYDDSGDGQVCWALDQAHADDHASAPTTFSIN